ncbi:MAG: DUF1883 domain-containing protein [Clostridiales bacterium]|nr:DUF1883 domain-containing protein [Clostridiales bacterium]
MNFRAYDMGNCKKGEIIEVLLKGDGVNVSIMDAPNYFEYKNARRHKYIGGHIDSSPYKVALPYDAHWYVTIDFGGYPGEAKCAVRKLSGKLPKLDTTKVGVMKVSTSGGSVDEEDIKSEFGLDLDPNSYGIKEFDFFIAYAKDRYKEIAQPLANSMAYKGKKICIEDFALTQGDNLTRVIQNGLTRAKRGILIVSDDFIKNEWLNYELDEILSIKRNDVNLITPIWHYITKDAIIKECGRAFLMTMEYNTMNHTIEELVAALLNINLVDEDVKNARSENDEFREIPLINI